MNHTQPIPWYEANQAYLAGAVSTVSTVLEAFAKSAESSSAPLSSSPARENQAEFSPPAALDSLCFNFGLSNFERTLLLMCAGTELDYRFPSICAAAHGDPRRSYPTFGLALAAFPDAHWSAISPARPLRRWNLLEIAGGDTLTGSPLRIPDRILCYLTGVYAFDEKLDVLVKPVPLPNPLPASHQAIAEKIAALWSQNMNGALLPIVNLCGDDLASNRTIAAAAAGLLGMRLYRTAEWMIPRMATELDGFLRLWEREITLGASALLLECNEREAGEGSDPFPHLMETLRGPLFISTVNPRRSAHCSTAVFSIGKPPLAEQRAIWRDALETRVPDLNGEVDTLVSQFSFGENAIRSATAQAVAQSTSENEEGAVSNNSLNLTDRLWDACRAQARPRLEGLAQQIEPAATWDDLVLPTRQKDILRQIAVHVRQRTKVYQCWGFASKGSRGLGISALFAGPSGTGKTMAAEVLAHDLRLDLYRIDLSQVVSKYIGETERNLRRVFDAAEEGAAVLLFDEADALFGKRSEVKDSHDRYANIEVSYLLQRMEAYRGLAILTSNRKNALDQAFLRRIRFVADFPFPDHEQRAQIWSRVFPALTPTSNLRMDRLARLNATGGHIRNIALGAAFLAADAGEPVQMGHLLSAARSEFAKLEKPLTDAAIAGWV